MRKAFVIVICLVIGWPSQAAYHYTRSVTNKKPPTGTPINSSHPSAKGLYHFYLMNESGGTKTYDLAGTDTASFDSNTTWTVSPYGPALKHTSGSAVGLTPAANFSLTTNWSWDAIIQVTGANGVSAYQNMFSQATSVGVWVHAVGATFVLDAFNGSDANDTTNLGTKTWHHVAITHGVNTTPTFYYVDGKLSSTTANMTTNWSISGLLQDSGGSPAEGFNGICVYQRFFNRFLSAAEIQQLYLDPFGVLQKPRIDLLRSPVILSQRGSIIINSAGRGEIKFRPGGLGVIRITGN